MIAAIESTLDRHGVGYRLGKTWTTDAIYRETRARVARRQAEGCIVVEMEASALFAVGAFRGVPVGQILYGGDDVSGLGDWDRRDWDNHSIREHLFWLAAESCLAYQRVRLVVAGPRAGEAAPGRELAFFALRFQPASDLFDRWMVGRDENREILEFLLRCGQRISIEVQQHGRG